MNIREVVADMVFILRAPVDGIDEAINASARYSEGWRRIGTLLRVVQTPWVLPRGYRRELVGVASTYFSAGSDPSITFMALYNKYTNILAQWLDQQYQALLATIAVALMISIASIIVIVGAPTIMPLASLVLLPIIHAFQVQITRYDYTMPGISGIIGSIVGFIISTLLHTNPLQAAVLTLMGFGTGFAVLYMPQFIRFLRDYTGMPGRVLTSFGELLMVHNPRPPRPVTIIERELAPLWEYAYSVGVREFIERVNMLVDSLLTFVRRSFNVGLAYGPFIIIGYLSMLFTYSILSSIKIHTTIPLLQPMTFAYTLLPLAVVTSLLVGKAIHSIGLGVSLIPIFLVPVLLMG